MTQTPEPWIWLQVEEATGKADACTCRLDAAGPDGDDSGAAFYMCPLHAAAPALLAALGAIQGDFVGHWIGCPARKLKPFTNEPVGPCPGTKDVCPTRWKRNQIKAAIAKASPQAQ